MIIEEIAKLEPLNHKKIGTDGKYHTVYLIEFLSGHFYVGKRTTENPETDDYFASGKLPNWYRNRGEQYTRTITHYRNSSADAIAIETKILESKLYDSDLCLNCYPGSPPDSSGRVCVTKGRKFKMVDHRLVEIYLNDGWVTGVPPRRIVFKNNTIKSVLVEDIEEYLDDGFIVGNPNARGRLFITNSDGELKFIKKEQFDVFQKLGWWVTHNQSGRKVIKIDGTIKKVSPEEAKILCDSGSATYSSTVEGLKYVRKDGIFKRIPTKEVERYLEAGWVVGNNTSNQIYITNGSSEKRIDAEDLDLYPGWVKGRINKIYLNNGEIERRFPTGDPKIAEFLSRGFVIGKLKRQKRMMVYRDQNRKHILPEQFSSYEKDGWTDKFDKSTHYHPRLNKKRSSGDISQ